MGLFIVCLITLPIWGNPFIVYLIILSCIATIAALGLNILTGLTGQISLGHAAFFAIGAYCTAILSHRFNMPFWICLPASAFLPALIGLLLGLPCLRLKGLYLAMATMSFGVVVEYVVITWDKVTHGVRGISVPTLSLFGYPLDSNDKIYYFVIIVAVLMVIGGTNLVRTRVGRAFVAIRDKDVAAEAIGIDLTKYKVMAFTISSLYAGLAGGLYAYVMNYIHPEHFTFLLSIRYLAMIIVGGLGTILGSIIGAVFIVITPEIIESLAKALTLIIPGLADKYNEEWNVAAFGLLIILFLMFEPTGLFGIWGRIKTCFKNWPFTY
jgi:branched-chain amino acid transport system permease protein